MSRRALAALFAALSLTGCPEPPPPPAPAPPPAPPPSAASAPTPAEPPAAAPGEGAPADGLKQAFGDLRAALDAKDLAKAARVAQGLFPTPGRARAVLLDPEGEAAGRLLAVHEGLRPQDEEGWAALLAVPPRRTEVRIHAATVEELRAPAEGSVAQREFPAGAQRVAEHLRPGRTFYELEVREPGQERGTRFHLFFRDEQGWCMLGPVWRGLR